MRLLPNRCSLYDSMHFGGTHGCTRSTADRDQADPNSGGALYPESAARSGSHQTEEPLDRYRLLSSVRAYAQVHRAGPVKPAKLKK